MDDLVDISKEVNELKTALHELFAEMDMTVVSIAIGVALGEAAEDEESLEETLMNTANMAVRVHKYGKQERVIH